MLIKPLMIVAGLMLVLAGCSTETQTRRTLHYENPLSRAWETVIMPDQPLKLHRHDYPRAIVVLEGGVLTLVNENHEKSGELVLETGKTYWLEADPPGELHGDINEGRRPVRVVVVEFRSK
ncbi:hypothetical protein [Kistimonas scapharcae]